MNIHNQFTVRYLSEMIDAHSWNESKLAQHAGLGRTTVSKHLTSQREIRTEHLAAYMKALAPTERNGLMAAWLKDVKQRLR